MSDEVLPEAEPYQLEQKQYQEKNAGAHNYVATTIVPQKEDTLPDYKPHNITELQMVLVLFAGLSALLGLAHDLHNLSKGNESLPKRSCGVRVHWGLVALLYLSKFVINGFIGLVLGWVTLYFLKLPLVMALAVAGIAGGQGVVLYNMLVAKLLNKVDKAGD